MKHFFSIASAILFLLAIGISCNQTDGQKKQSKSDNPTDTLDRSMALKIGTNYAQQTGKALMGLLKKTIKEKGVPQAVTFCSHKAIPLTDSMAQNFGAVIKRVSEKNRNPDDAPVGIEKEVLAFYNTLIENNEKPYPKVWTLDQDTLMVSAPITIPNALCLNCHGQPNQQITEETMAAINSEYPNDKATGYKVDDFRGFWAIKFPKSNTNKNL